MTDTATASSPVRLTVAPDLVVWQGTPGVAIVFSASRGVAMYSTLEVATALANRPADLRRALDEIGGPDAYSTLVQPLLDASILLEDQRGTGAADFHSDGLAKMRSGATVRFLDLVVSEGCNFACPHCIHARDVQTSASRALNTYMKPEVAKRAIDEFCALQRANNQNELFIHIGSSEPLVNWETTRYVVEYVSGLEGFASKRITLNSNLSLLTRDRAQFLVDRGVIISTSLDGVRSDNNLIRIRKNGEGTFDTIVDRIGMLRECGYQMDSVSLTVTNLTIRRFDMSGYLDLLQTLGMTGVSVDFDLVGSAEVPATEVASFLLRFYDACRQRGIECYGTWTKPFENLFLDHSDAAQLPLVGFCKAVEGGNVSVSPQGNLFMCGYTSTSLGSLGEMSSRYPELLTELLRHRQDTVSSHCTGCSLIAVCGGQCHTTHEVAGFEASPKVDVMCDVYRAVTRGLAERKLQVDSGHNA